MNHEPTHLLDQCLRRVLVERGGSPVALEVNASLARRRLTVPSEVLVDAELEVIVALASREPRDALAERVRDLGARWAERSPARGQALERAATMLVNGHVPPQPTAMASVVAMGERPVPNLRGRAPLVALAALLLAGAAGGAWFLTRATGKKDDSVAVAPAYQIKQDLPAVGLERKGGGDRKVDWAEPAPQPSPPAYAAEQLDVGNAHAEMAAADLATAVDPAASPAAVHEQYRAALERADWDALGGALAADVFHLGPDATDVTSGRDATIAALRALLPRDASPAEPQLAIASSATGEHEGLAWSLDDLSWTHARPGRKPTTSRYLVSRVAMRRGDRWEIVASSWARRTSDSRLAAASAAGVAPALAPIPVAPGVDMTPAHAFELAMASRDALEAFILPGDTADALGSDAEKDEGGRAVARRYKKLGGRLYPLGEAHVQYGPDGLAAWIATNVELVSASKASGDVVLPYRVLAVLAHDPGMGTWKAVMLHWSAGGPVPRVKGAARPSSGEESDEPVADPTAVAAAAEPLTGAELRTAFGAVREAVEACRAVAGDEPAAPADGAAPPPPPRVLVKVVASVTAEGAVDSVDVEGAWAGTAHAGCVEEVVAGMTFRAPGAAQTVRYPFAL